jgi:hypothetical protein
MIAWTSSLANMSTSDVEEIIAIQITQGHLNRQSINLFKEHDYQMKTSLTLRPTVFFVVQWLNFLDGRGVVMFFL